MTDPHRLADTFVGAMRAALGERLRAASLFGSVARGEWAEDVSDINVLILVERIDAQLLAAAAPAAKKAVSIGVTPLLMERDEWTRAADVFAIELADMRDASMTLAGDDPAAGTVVQPALLRLQAERELRAKLLHLHAGMLLGADDPQRLGRLLMHALPSFTTYLRTALRLAEQPVPRTTGEVIAAGCALAGAEPRAFAAVHDARANGGHFEVQLDGLVHDFNTAAERLAAYIDAFGGDHS